MSEMPEWDDDTERQFCEVFDQLDPDGKGFLTVDEIKNGGLEQGTTALGYNPSDDEIIHFIEAVDADGEKAVSKEEFKTILQNFIAAIKEHMSAQQQPEEENEFVLDESNFEEVFNYLDTDGSNVLTFDELQKGSLIKAAQLLDRNPTYEEVQQFLDDMHIDDGDEISKEDFRTYLQQFMAKLQDDPDATLERAVDDIMEAIDTDGNGLCTKDEFKMFLQNNGRAPLSAEEVDDLFNAVDTDGNTSTLNKEDLLHVLLIGTLHNEQG